MAMDSSVVGSPASPSDGSPLLLDTGARPGSSGDAARTEVPTEPAQIGDGEQNQETEADGASDSAEDVVSDSAVDSLLDGPEHTDAQHADTYDADAHETLDTRDDADSETKMIADTAGHDVHSEAGDVGRSRVATDSASATSPLSTTHSLPEVSP
mgnify:FL=1